MTALVVVGDLAKVLKSHFSVLLNYVMPVLMQSLSVSDMCARTCTPVGGVAAHVCVYMCQLEVWLLMCVCTRTSRRCGCLCVYVHVPVGGVAAHVCTYVHVPVGSGAAYVCTYVHVPVGGVAAHVCTYMYQLEVWLLMCVHTCASWRCGCSCVYVRTCASWRCGCSCVYVHVPVGGMAAHVCMYMCQLEVWLLMCVYTYRDQLEVLEVCTMCLQYSKTCL